MNSLLAQLDSTARVLDLGCGFGSFSYEDCAARVIALDQYVADPARARERMSGERIHYVLGTALDLPLASASVDLVIGNHIFEHVYEPQRMAAEISRVLKPSGLLFVSIPDGFSFSDGLYRWWSKGGGHVQRFTFRSFQETVESGADLALLYAYRLYSSFSFLNPGQARSCSVPPRARWLWQAPLLGPAKVLAGLNLLTRAADARLGTRSSLYGWAFYFGKPEAMLQSVYREEHINVCATCGCGHSGGWLERMGKLRPHFGFRIFFCEVCAARNLYFGDDYARRILGSGLAEEEAPGPDICWEPPEESDGRPVEGPIINSDGLVDAASFRPRLAPGGLFAVFGKNLAPEAHSAESDPWPIELAGVQLMVNRRPARVGYVSPEQIVAQLPPDTPRGAASFAVLSQGILSPFRRAVVTLTAPALLSVDSTGRGRGLCHHAVAGELVTSENPARPGEIITLQATGLGPVVPPLTAGQAAPASPLYLTTRRAKVLWVGSGPAEVEFCGLQPGAVGLYQVNVRLPRRLPPGEATVVLEIGGRLSNPVTLPVAP